MTNNHQRIWAIAGPAILANISAPLIALVDTWAIGHLPGAKYLAAVGLATTIFTFILWAFGFLRMGTTGLVAQADGKGDKVQLHIICARALTIGLIAGLVMMMLSREAVLLGISLMEAPAETRPLVMEYALIRQYSMPASLMIYALNGILIGLAKTKSALVLQLVLNIANGILNVIFVIGLGMGVEGVALGTVLAEWLAVLTGIYLLSKHIDLPALLKAFIAARTWHLAAFARFMALNGFIFARTLLLMTTGILVMAQSSHYGSDAVAASHIMNQFSLLISLGLDGIAYAVEALAGNAYGARDRVRFRYWSITTTLWAVALSLVYTAGFWAFGEGIVFTLTEVESVRIAMHNLMPVILAMPLVAVWSYQFDGIFISATDTKAMFATMLVSFAAFFVALEFLPAAYGFQGIWLAMLVFLATRGLSQAIWYPRIEKRLV